MRFFGNDLPGSSGLFSGPEAAFADSFASSNPYLEIEGIVSRKAGVDAMEPGGVLARDSVSHVVGVGGEPKIFPSVVGADSISMIDFIRRPFSGHVKPRQTVAEVISAVYSDLDVAIVRLDGASFAAREGFSSTDEPNEDARLCVISQKGLEAIYGKFGLHPPSLGVDATWHKELV